MRFFRFFIFIIALAALPLSAIADKAIDVRLDLSTEEVSLDDSFQLFVVFKNSNNYSLRLDSLDMPGLNNFKQIGTSRSSKTQIINGQVSSVTEISLTLMPTKVGEFEIGPLVISSGKTKIKSNTVSIKVINKNSALFSRFSNKPKNTKTKSRINYSRIILNIFALALLVYFVWRIYEQKKEKEIITQEKKEEKQVKIKNLQKQIPNKDDPEFYKKIRILLYEYLAREYGFKTKSLTTRELLSVLDEKNIPIRKSVKEILEMCDRAHFGAQNQDKKELLNLVLNIIT